MEASRVSEPMGILNCHILIFFISMSGFVVKCIPLLFIVCENGRGMQGYETNTKSPLTVYTSTRSLIIFCEMSHANALYPMQQLLIRLRAGISASQYVVTFIWDAMPKDGTRPNLS